MNLDRSLIKSQAKQLIKGNVFKFFVVIFVVTVLTGGATGFATGINSASNAADEFGEKYSQGIDDAQSDFDEFGLGDFAEDGDINEFDIDDFFDDEPEVISPYKKSIFSGIASTFSGLMGMVSLFLAPLAITLAGVFYSLIKGKNMSWNEEFSYVFSKTFDKNYWNKFLLNLLTGIFTVLWSLLFIIPGIIYYYKIYFVSFIMAEKPELSWKEAINISKKMTDGHKGELFVLDLSFIGWGILTGITFGLVGIYVLPYQYTTRALYYENFKIRAFQLGVMSEADYMTEGEKAQIAFANAQQQGTYSVPTPMPAAPAPQAPVQEAPQAVETPDETPEPPAAE